ncbi:MAG: TIR domain-containing protein, partial [Acidobacteria bacterium]|nr:TIR domain-containing protein [Acidobacteriota bacterium]
MGSEEFRTVMSSVFISYSSQDYETAARIRTSLTNRGVRVTIDRHDLTGNIDEFIQNAIRDNAYTLTIISERSLASAWVGQESMTTIYGEKFQQERKYIACYLDEEFLQDDCITRAAQSINSRIKNLESEIKKAQRAGANPTNLENKKKRLFNLKSHLGDILERLNNDLVYDVREPKYEESIAKILTIVSPGLPPPDATRQKELAYLDKLEKEGIKDRTKYTPLGGRATQIPSIRDEFDFRPCEKINVGLNTSKQLEPRRFDDAVGEILKLNRAVVLGEPGAGKTTTLWKLVGDLSEKSRQDARAPLPMMIRLGKWTNEEEPFEAFLSGQLGDLADQLELLVDKNRVVLLLDGLNEIPAGQRKGKTDQIRAYIEDPKWSKTTVIISCRQLDYRQNELEMDRVEIVPLDPVRIREFVGRYLGEVTGEQLFWRLAGKEAQSAYQKFQQSFGENWSNWETVFWNAADLPSGTTWGWDNTYWNNWLKVREHPSSLMVLARNPFMLMLLYSVYEENANTLQDNRSGLFERFIEILFKRENIDTGDRQ